jgi:hypothetical protein
MADLTVVGRDEPVEVLAALLRRNNRLAVAALSLIIEKTMRQYRTLCAKGLAVALTKLEMVRPQFSPP